MALYTESTALNRDGIPGAELNTNGETHCGISGARLLGWSGHTLSWLLPIASFIAVFDASMVSVVLPALRTDLDLSPSTASWVVNSYLVAFGGLMLLGGRFADVVARRALLTFGFTLYAAGSVVSALAPWGYILVAARMVQGGAAALFVPVALALIATDIHGAAQRARAYAWWGVASGVGAAAGALTGGVLASTLGWRWAFPAAGAVAAFGALMVMKRVASSDGRGGSVDAKSAVCATAGLACLIYALISGAEHGMQLDIVVAAVCGLALMGGVIWSRRRERRSSFTPVSRAASTASLVMFALGGSSAAALFLLPLYLHAVPGWSSAAAGAVLLVPTSAIVSASVVAPALTARFGPTTVLFAGLGLTTSGLVFIAPTPQHLTGPTGLAIIAATGVVGFGVGLSFVVATALGMATAADRSEGSASGILSAAREVGAAAGIALVTAAAALLDAPGLGGPEGGFGSSYAIALFAAASLPPVAILAVLIDPSYRRLGILRPN